MDEKTCKNLYQRYLELESKMRSGEGEIKRGQPIKVIVNSHDIFESNEMKNKLGDCLEFLLDDELFKLYTDEVLGPKARTILKERRSE